MDYLYQDGHLPSFARTCKGRVGISIAVLDGHDVVVPPIAIAVLELREMQMRRHVEIVARIQRRRGRRHHYHEVHERQAERLHLNADKRSTLLKRVGAPLGATEAACCSFISRLLLYGCRKHHRKASKLVASPGMEKRRVRLYSNNSKIVASRLVVLRFVSWRNYIENLHSKLKI